MLYSTFSVRPLQNHHINEKYKYLKNLIVRNYIIKKVYNLQLSRDQLPALYLPHLCTLILSVQRPESIICLDL